MPRRQVARRCGTYETARGRCPIADTPVKAAENILGADEMEALRLSDLMEMTQVEAARQMGSRRAPFSASSLRRTARSPGRSWTTDP